MGTSADARSAGLDISLLGVIVAAVGYYAGRFPDAGGVTPNLIRFFEQPPGTRYPAVMPQDAALLLLADPSTNPSTSVPDPVALPFEPSGVGVLLLYLGLVLVLLGPLWAATQR